MKNHTAFPLFSALALGCALVAPVRAQINAPALQASLDHTLTLTEASGGAAAIVRAGEVLWHGQTGVIAPGSATAVGPDTLFAYASVGKMSTAALTLRLVEQGRVNLDTPIGAYLTPAYTLPGAGEVTVRQLLNHTSGYADLYAQPGVVERLLDPNHPWAAAVLRAVDPTPETTPGSTHSYSNTNYIVLSELVARTAGTTFGEFYQTEIAGPLGLTRSFATPRPREEFAQGVRGSGEEAVNFFDGTAGVPSALYGEIFGDGPLAGNAADGARFLDALVHGEVLSPDTLGEMLDFDPLSGSGLGIAMFATGDGQTWIGHSGSWGGYTALALYNPDLDLTFMTLANQEGVDETQPLSALLLMNAVVTTSVTAIPEPGASAALVGALAFGAVGGVRRRRPVAQV